MWYLHVKLHTPMLRTIGQIAFNSSYHDTILIKFTNKYRYAEPVDKPNDMKYSYIKVKVSDVNYNILQLCSQRLYSKWCMCIVTSLVRLIMPHHSGTELLAGCSDVR